MVAIEESAIRGCCVIQRIRGGALGGGALGGGWGAGGWFDLSQRRQVSWGCSSWHNARVSSHLITYGVVANRGEGLSDSNCLNTYSAENSISRNCNWRF